MMEKALLIAANAHKGQVDKGGNPYILHPLAVMQSLYDEDERICAILHDVIEDTDVTLEYLENQGFSEKVLSALDALTRRKNESYDEFIDRIITNKLAAHVKLADLSDNMDISRIEKPSKEDYERIEKYRKAEEKIKNAIS